MVYNQTLSKQLGHEFELPYNGVITMVTDFIRRLLYKN